MRHGKGRPAQKTAPGRKHGSRGDPWGDQEFDHAAPVFGGESMSRILNVLRSLGLTAQFLLLATVLYTVLAIGAGRMQNHLISERMIEGSLEIEQALARGVLLSILGDEPIRSFMPMVQQRQVHDAVTTQIDPAYISKVKIWGVDGALVYNSDGPVDALPSLEPAVMRAVHGETVISRADEVSAENFSDMNLGSIIYEVYMPLVNDKGEVIAVGEIYCSVELLMARISRMLADTDYIRLASLLIGIAGLAVLVAFAQRRIAEQERSIAASLRRADEYAERNRQLFNESERLRTQATQISEALLSRIGSELHDGPIQLLSIAALYRSQLAHAETEMPLARKASDLLDAALTDLRSISTGLVMPTLDGLDLPDTLRLAVQNFRTECGTDVALGLGEVDIALAPDTRTAIYRIVSEALHNARKHAESRGVAVSAEVEGESLVIVVSDKGPGMRQSAEEKRPGSHVSLGLAGMRNRAKSIGAQLDILSRPGRGTQVRLTLDLHLGQPSETTGSRDAGHDDTQPMDGRVYALRREV